MEPYGDFGSFECPSPRFMMVLFWNFFCRYYGYDTRPANWSDWILIFFFKTKWPPPKKIKVAYWPEMTRNQNESGLRTSKMADGGHFVKKNKSCVLTWNGEKSKRKWSTDIQNGRRQPFCKKNIMGLIFFVLCFRWQQQWITCLSVRLTHCFV